MSQLQTKVENFVNGYVAGSSNSYDVCFEALKEELPDVDETELQCLFDNVIEQEEIFLCSECGWWCWSHEVSFNNSSVCTDCAGDEDE